ncbi:MAG: site-specific DNA-methyltransferase [DPANN group archaeon]|nr:site-specific DNA-methyltransferase [DPANN group archaeon]
MKKLTMTTKDLTQENIAKLIKLFPEIITEVEKDGNLIKTINADKLKELVGDYADNNSEVYDLTWAGKQKSRQKIVMPINKTLRPVPGDSVDFENTENLYIEGDNFEVLKLLQESYLNKIKMIYIDPPYNTGKDFVYKDNFTKSKNAEDKESGAIDEGGNKLFKNTTTNGRFHSDWLSMMFERLVIAKDLLRDDGVIFISIDDNEVDNLKKICDEIFGGGNFISQLVWENKEGGGSSDSKFFRIKHEYILCYAKDIDECGIQGETTQEDNSYSYEDEFVKERGRYKLIKLNSFSIQYSKSLDYEIKLPNGEKVTPSENGKRGCWRWSQSKYEWGLKNRFIEIRKNTDGKLWVYTKQYFKVDHNGEPISRQVPFRAVISKYSSTQATKQMEKLFGTKIFDYSKPYDLIQFLCAISSNEGDIILDFFSGSATTAHAVMQLNAEDGGNRKFIMVQLPEPTAEDSEAFKAGYKNICEIGKERIRRAAKKIQDDNKDKDLKNVDFGFRVFKTDSSNMKDVYYNPNEIDQRTLTNFKNNIKEDRTDKDLLYQVLLELAIPISAKIEEQKLNNKTIYKVNDTFLIACFDNDIDLETIKQIAELNPSRIVFKDSSFKDDSTKVNCDEYLKNKIPNTIVKVI